VQPSELLAFDVEDLRFWVESFHLLNKSRG